MLRWLTVAACVVVLVGCATPQVVKDSSRQQGELLGAFHHTLGELRTKLLAFYDEAIEEYRRSLLTSRLTFERSRVAVRTAEAVARVDRALPPEQRAARVKEILDAAANYLTELPAFYFERTYCAVWPTLKPAFLRDPDERCQDEHVQRYQALLADRQDVAVRFDRLVRAVGRTREAHDLVNEFLQIEFRLTRERVDAAKKVIEETHKTLEEAKAVWSKLQAEAGKAR